MADTHVYGTADPDDRQTPTANGFHGEAKAPLAQPPADRPRTVVAEGQRITVEQQSGVAAAEAAGNIHADDQGDEEETAGSG